MESPFLQDKSGQARQGAFLNSPAPSAGGLRPLTAVDIAPPAGSGAPPGLGAALNPFLGGYPAPFAGDAGPTRPAELPGIGFSGEPAPAPEGFQPERVAPPVAARQSAILAAAEAQAGAVSAIRPRFFLTTTAELDGFSIQAYLDVVSVEVVLPKDLLFRNPAPYGELHRLKAAEEQLQRVRVKALEELSEKARLINADGIIGLTVSFVNLDTVCCLCSAVGTAVRVS